MPGRELYRVIFLILDLISFFFFFKLKKVTFEFENFFFFFLKASKVFDQFFHSISTNFKFKKYVPRFLIHLHEKITPEPIFRKNLIEKRGTAFVIKHRYAGKALPRETWTWKNKVNFKRPSLRRASGFVSRNRHHTIHFPLGGLLLFDLWRVSPEDWVFFFFL